MRLRSTSIAVLCVLVAAVPDLFAAETAPAPQSAPLVPPQSAIMFLVAEDPTQLYARMITDGFRDAVQAAPNPPVVYQEFLDGTRFDDPAYVEGFRSWLHDKYRDRLIDLVVPIGEDALYFLSDKHGEPWRDVPVLYLEAGGLSRDIRGQLSRASGLIVEDSFPAQLAVVKRILPDTDHVVIIYGASTLERTRASGFADRVREANLGLDATEWAGLPIEEIVARVAHLPERTIVFFFNPQTDGTGRIFTVRWLCELITAAANRPTFSMPIEHVGWGVVGGRVRDFEKVGTVLAEHVLARLRAPTADWDTIRVPLASFTTLAFDERQLRRWNISEDLLPPGSVVQFREPDLWRDYRGTVLSATAIGVILSGLVVGLLFEHRRRTAAEVGARRQLAGMAHLERRAAMGQLTAALAHELKQPLAAILRNAEAGTMLLATGMPHTDDEIREIFEDIRADDTRANGVIERLRGLLQKRELLMQPVDVNELVRETVKLLTPDAAARGVHVDTELASSPSMVTGDRVHLQQVLLNLMLNGMDATAGMPPECRSLMIRTSWNDGRVDVQVRDTGQGIRADSASRIFDPFFTTKADGMGMGLSIARSIVEAHDGNMAADNNPEGGATIGFSIPRQRIE
jgi:signal transduction histidine kinase